MLAVIFGLLFAIMGIWGIVTWWSDYIIVLKGLVPFMLFCGGIISIIVGISAISDSLKSKESPGREENIE
ncbi:MAG: hypothetical protein LHV68_07935 [Elusimicrobia bacterium]|nr:hypothetical protein [Candidatus Liberimonas magnetica]